MNFPPLVKRPYSIWNIDIKVVDTQGLILYIPGGVPISYRVSVSISPTTLYKYNL